MVGVTDSSTGGPLLPVPSPAPTPLEGKALLAFFSQFIVGLTGLDGAMVRPRWQAEAPVLPAIGEAWASFGIASRKGDAWPYVGRILSGSSEVDQLQRHEDLAILCSFYDSGSSGLADQYASLLRDGLAVAQNREILSVNGMGLAETGDLISVPSLIKVRWLYRVDLPFTIRRNVVRQFKILSLEEADIGLQAQEGNDPVIRRSLDISDP